MFPQSDKRQCGAEVPTCPYPITNKDNVETHCVTARYSNERLVAPFPDDATEVDWRTKGVINPIKDQGSCGSCWAFMATGALEPLRAIQMGKLHDLSEQQLVDCDTVYNSGC